MNRPSGYPLRIDRHLFVPMADGTRIALTLYLPDAPQDGPFPAVVESLPYRKDDDCAARDYSTYAYLAARGIAGVRIDIRGTGASTGIIADEYMAQEQADNLEVFSWLEMQDWCTGHLGMWGISWGGFSALQTAMLQPDQLKAIAAVHATHDRFACDVHYTGGSAHAAELLDWPGFMVTMNALPPDPDIFGDEWYDEWMRRLDLTPQWPFEWLRHQKRDGYWLHGSPCADYAAIQCPTLLIGGWLDGYVDGMLEMAEKLECETRTLIGPWGHSRPATGSPLPTYDHLDLFARWFGHHLRGDDNDIMEMPAVTLYARTMPPYDAGTVPGAWQTTDSWPPPETTPIPLGLSDLNHDKLSWRGPQWVGSHAPFWDRAGFGATDSEEDDSASMTFETKPLEKPLEILGMPRLKMRVTTDRTVGMVAARLLAVDPGGTGYLICRGNRNLAFPKDLSTPITPEPLAPTDVTLTMRTTSATIPAGWRLRLSLAGADFPVVWPPKDSFTLTLEPSKSTLEIPIVTRPLNRAPEIGLSPPPPSSDTEVREEKSDWVLFREDASAIFKRSSARTEYQPFRDDLTYWNRQDWTVSVDDGAPASTSAFTESAAGLMRPGWEVSTRGSIKIEGHDEFEVAIELAADHNGREVFRRRWEHRIPREWA